MGSFSSALPLIARATHLVSAAPYTHGGSAPHALSGSRKKYREPTEKECAPRSIGDEGGVHERSAEELAPAESCSARKGNGVASRRSVTAGGGKAVARRKSRAARSDAQRELGSES